jgi:hypothetical protein
MKLKWLALLPAVLALGGCGASQQVRLAQSQGIAWDGQGRDPNLPAISRGRVKTEKPEAANEGREAELAGLPEYSREWVAVRKVMDTEEDARLSKLLVICRGCGSANSEINRVSQSATTTPDGRMTQYSTR